MTRNDEQESWLSFRKGLQSPPIAKPLTLLAQAVRHPGPNNMITTGPAHHQFACPCNMIRRFDVAVKTMHV